MGYLYTLVSYEYIPAVMEEPAQDPFLGGHQAMHSSLPWAALLIVSYGVPVLAPTLTSLYSVLVSRALTHARV